MFNGLHIIKARIADLLQTMNYYRFDIDYENNSYVHIESNMLQEVSREEIIDRFFIWLNDLAEYSHEVAIKDNNSIEVSVHNTLIRETMYEKLSEYFSKSILNRLTRETPIEIQQDTKTEKYFYFQNGYVIVNKDGFELKQMDELKHLVWRSKVLERNFVLDNTVGDFEKFVENICNQDPQRKKALMTILGYNLHCFFDRKLFATILTDSTKEADENNGRSGKGLVIESLKHMVNSTDISRSYIEIDGKKMREKGKHVFEAASIETFIVHINDIYRNATLEQFYNAILTGIEVDKKNKNPFTIRAKMLISTNKTIKIEGSSDRDRVIMFEVSDYYNDSRSPVGEFNKWFYSQDWSTDDWNQYTTFMLKCCVEFFKHDVIEAESVNLHYRFLIDHTSTEFVKFMDELVNGIPTYYMVEEEKGRFIEYPVKIEWGERMDKKELYTAFLHHYKTYFTRVPDQKRFTRWIKFYTKYKEGIEEITAKSGLEFRSNNVDYIIFKKDE